ncbi:MAG: SDR family oxidoreductase [Bacteroidota bacterium]
MPLPDLTGAVVLVTGASRGLGRATALAFAREGAHVVGLARSEGDLGETASAIAGDAQASGSGGAFTAIEADVTDGAQMEAAFERIDRDLGRLDVLVNNAGLGRFGEVTDLSLDDWNVQVDTNLTGLFRATKLAVPRMVASGEGVAKGHVINVASVAGLIGNPQISAYNATKFGVRGFSEAIMKELRPKGVRVTCVYPGSIETHFFEEAGVSMNPNAMTAESVAASILHAVQAPAGTLVSEIVMRPMQVG